MSKKTYLLGADEIQPIANGFGDCIASDEITVSGARVELMFRAPPSGEEDSGWRFLADCDPDKFNDDVAGQGVFDVNTIANYDRDIVPLLDTPVGKAYARKGVDGTFVQVESPVDPDDCLHPDFPIVTGSHQLHHGWTIDLPYKFNRRDQGDELVFWRVGMTILISLWENDDNDSVDHRIDWFRSVMSDEAFDIEETVSSDCHRLTYRLDEERDSDTMYAMYGFCVTRVGHAQLSVYTDSAPDIDTAKEIVTNVIFQ
ncbi:MAG: DUF2185 domain-containing protein [Pirellulaceae bacterium]